MTLVATQKLLPVNGPLSFVEKTKVLAPSFLASGLVHLLLAALLVLGLSGKEWSDESEIDPFIPVQVRALAIRKPKTAPKEQELPQTREEGMMLEERDIETSMEESKEAQKILEQEQAKELLPDEKGIADLLRDLLLDDLELALEEEAQSLDDLNDLQQAQVYLSAITASIEKQWSRPLNARSGMVAKLHIKLIPTGEIVDVSVVSSSHYPAFDRSAEQAARKASPLPVPEDSTLFERHFRGLTIIFNPSDLKQ